MVMDSHRLMLRACGQDRDGPVSLSVIRLSNHFRRRLNVPTIHTAKLWPGPPISTVYLATYLLDRTCCFRGAFLGVT